VPVREAVPLFAETE
jgi:hypothetical protein